MREVADETGATPGQLALAWVLAQGDDVVPIPGTKRGRYLEENVGRHRGVADADEQLRRLDEPLPPGAVAGERYLGGSGWRPLERLSLRPHAGSRL